MTAAVTIADLTEQALVTRIQRQLPPAPPWMVVGIGDDGAVIEPEPNRLDVLTVDALVEGVHFDWAFTPATAVGHRALAVNLSDLAAMGATPRLGLLSLMLPGALRLDRFDGMIAGLAALASRQRMHLAGGNLTRTRGPLVVDVTLMGTVKRRRTLTRRGARPGDDIYVSGTLGAAAAGLQMLQARRHHGETGDGAVADPLDHVCQQRYLYPEPRVRLGSLLGSNRAASACMDLSDGLADAVRRVAEASGVGATIDADALPIDAGARRWFEAAGCDAVQATLCGGDDYELLFTARPRTRGRLQAARRHGEVAFCRIGTCTADSAIVVRQNGADREMPQGYTHFQ